MRMLDAELKITLKLAGPVLTKSTSMEQPGTDAAMVRDSHDRCCLPASHVKGKLKEAWEQLGVPPADIERWLGAASGNQQSPGSAFHPRRGRLEWSDFVDLGPPRPHSVRTRTALDHERGAVAQGALLVLESPYQPGEVAEFTGAIRYLVEESEAPVIRRMIRKGLEWLHGLGAQQAISFGRLLRVDLVESHTQYAAPAVGTPSDVSIGFRLTPEAPFCIPRHRGYQNVMESEVVIPGGALKGAFATTWLWILGLDPNTPITEDIDPSRKELGRYFSRIVFRHALPVANDAACMPVQIPQSVVSLPTLDGQWWDVARLDTLSPIAGAAPEFSIDWKSAQRNPILTAFGWKIPAKELRVRTAIDRDKRRALDEALFAQELVQPAGFTWHASADLFAVPEHDLPKAASQLLDLLSRGIRNLGKTHVRLGVAPGASLPPAQPSKPELRDGIYVITLQTPALLAHGPNLEHERDPEALFAEYRRVFAEISGNSMELVRFYARQSLAGGLYLHRRASTGPYTPYLLTDTGSAFVLHVTQPEVAKAKINEWLHLGLEPPASAGCSRADAWKTCPYVRENGYGEIAVNLDAHWKPMPVVAEKCNA